MTPPSVGSVQPVRRDPAVVVGIISGTASVIVGITSLLGTLFTAHQPTTTPPPSGTVQGQSLTSCLTVAEGYRTELIRDPAMIGVLDSIVMRDPQARRCGIDSATLRTMLRH